MPLPLLTLALAGFTSTILPYTKTAAADLSPPGYQHLEVLRMTRDFGNRDFKVVLDTWVQDDSDALAELRLWWVRDDLEDQRAPFGSKIRRHMGLDISQNSPSDWTLRLTGDRKEFVFDVELATDGSAAAYAHVRSSTGDFEHCRATDAKFVAKRLFGIPIGIRRLDMHCVTDDGTAVQGELVFNKLKRGRLWS